MSFHFLPPATIVLTCSIALVQTIPTITYAQTSPVLEAKHRVNIAGRQRMLSQRMSKAACFIHSGVNVDAHMAMLKDAFDLFSTSHKVLVSGSNDTGLRAETSPAILEKLALVDQKWASFAPYVQEVLSTSTIDGAQIAKMDAAGLALLKDMNGAVNTIATEYGTLLEDLPLIQSITIDVAGRQRMLSQKAAKEFCLIASDIDAEQNSEKLAGTIHLFSTTLDALTTGMTGLVIAPPNDETSAMLEQVKAEWRVPSAIFDRTLNVAQPCCGHRQVIAEQMELVLDYMNQAVGMYETAQ